MRAGREWLACLFLLAASCKTGASGPDAGAASSQSPATAEPVDSISQIEGQWDIVSFEGYDPQRLSGSVRAAYADFGPNGVSLRIECNYSGRSGTVREGRFIPAADDDMIQTQMGCGPEREARDSRYFAFFSRSPTIEHLPGGHLRLRADGTELILERPVKRRLAYLPAPSELQGEWRLLELTRYVPEGGFTGIGLSETPGRIVFSGNTISYSRCPQYDLQFLFSEDGVLVKTGGADLPAEPIGCPELSEGLHGEGLPVPWDALRVLHSNPKVEKSGENQLLVSTDRLGLLLARAPR